MTGTAKALLDQAGPGSLSSPGKVLAPGLFGASLPDHLGWHHLIARPFALQGPYLRQLLHCNSDSGLQIISQLPCPGPCCRETHSPLSLPQ